MNDLDELYQTIILGHNKNPRNEGSLASCTHQAEGFNPLCGDHIVVQLEKNGDVVEDIRFTSQSCAIAKASASLMTTAIKGLSESEIHERVRKALELLGGNEEAVDPLELGEMAALTGVKKFPARVKCATLAWHTLESALASPKEARTDES